MSARSLIVLALVAIVVVEANSFPYGAKGGQSYYQEPLKGQQVYQQREPLRQPLESFKSPAPLVQSHQAEPAPMPVAMPAVQTYEMPAKGVQSSWQEPRSWQEPLKGAQPQQQVYRQPAPVQQHFEAAPAVQSHQSFEAPAKGGQTFYQAPQQQSYQESYKGAQFVQQPLRQQAAVAETFKSVPHVAQQPLQQSSQLVESAPVAAPAPTFQSTQTYEAPVKGAQTFYQAPQQQYIRAPAVQQVSQSHVEAVAAAPAVQSTQTTYEAPAKGQSFYQAPQQQYVRAPAVQQVAQSHAEPVAAAPAVQTTQTTYEAAPVKGSQTFYQPAQQQSYQESYKGAQFVQQPLRQQAAVAEPLHAAKLA